VILFRDNSTGILFVVGEEFVTEPGETETIVFFRGPFDEGTCFEGGSCAIGVGFDLCGGVEGFVCDGVPAAVGAFVNVS
jgi:hypothetical protein